MAFKDTKNSDFVVGLVMAAAGADRFLLDEIRDRLDLPGTLVAVRGLTKKWPYANLKLVEDKANGPAVIQSLRHQISGLVEVNPEGGKVSRAAAASPQLESGNWYLPHPMLAPWVESFIRECSAFPAGAHDDQVELGAKELSVYCTIGLSQSLCPSQCDTTARVLGWFDTAPSLLPSNSRGAP